MNTEKTTNVIPPKPRGGDYTDRKQYHRDWYQWRMKYEVGYRERRNISCKLRNAKRYREDVEFRSNKKYTHNQFYTVYELSNTICDTKYIGITKQKLNVRFSSHLSHKAMSKLGKFIDDARIYSNIRDVFSIKALIENIQTKEEALKLERDTIHCMLDNGVTLFNQIMNTNVFDKKRKRRSSTTLYKITNTINNVLYIGVTTYTLRDRLGSHKSSAFTTNTHSKWYNFIRTVSTKDTFNKIFKIHPVVENISDIDTAHQLENELITKLTYSGIELFNSGCGIKDTFKFGDYLDKYCGTGESSLLLNTGDGISLKTPIDSSIIEKLTLDGNSSYKMANILNMSVSRICEIRRTIGVVSKAKGGVQTKITQHIIDAVKDMILCGKTTYEISDELGIHQATVCSILKK